MTRLWVAVGRRFGYLLLTVGLLTAALGAIAQDPTQDVQAQAAGARAGLYRAGVMPVDGLGVSCGVPGVLLAVGGSGITYSLDNGATWQIPTRPDSSAPAVRPDPYAAVAAIAPRDTSGGGANVRFLIANRNRFWRSGDYGATWAVDALANHPDCAAYPDDARIRSIQVNPRTPTQLIARMQCLVRYDLSPLNVPVAVFRSYVLVSNDAGLTWTLTGWSTFTDVIFSLAVSGRVFARVGTSSWQQSDDNGVSWAARTWPVTDLATDAQSVTLLYGRSSDGRSLLISTDNGQTWAAPIAVPDIFGAPYTISTMAGSPSTTGLVFIKCAETGGWQRYAQTTGQWLTLDLPNTSSPTQGQARVDLIVDHTAPGRLFFTYPTGLRQFDAAGLNLQLPEARFPAPLANEWRIHLSSPWSWRNMGGADWTNDGQVWATFPLAGPNTMVRWNGQAWSTSNPGSCDPLDMLTPTLGFAGCDGLRRWDGSDWGVEDATLVPARLSMVTATVGMAAGYRLNTAEQGIYLRNAGGWSLVRPVTGTLQTTVGDAILDLDMIAADFAWVVENGRILRWDGAQFTESATGLTPAPYMTAISALDRDNAWAVGRDGVALRWNGSAWQPYYNVSPYNETLIDVVMVSPSEAWALAEGSNVLHFINGSWEYSAGPVMQARRLILPPTGEQWVLGDQPCERMSLVYLPQLNR